MNRKIPILLISLAILAPFHLAQAAIVINEVMYNLKTGSDSGREWVEIYNDGSASVDLSTYRFFEADTNHKLTAIEGGTIIGAQSYAVIVSDAKKFKIDWPNYSGIILDSTFSLSNTGEALAIKKGEDVADEYSYGSGMGGAGSGTTLGKINGAWKETTATPGIENKIAPPAPKKEAVVKKALTETDEGDGKTSAQRFQKAKTSAEVSEIPAKSSNLYFFIIIFVVLAGLGGGFVYFLRRPASAQNIIDDYEILED